MSVNNSARPLFIMSKEQLEAVSYELSAFLKASVQKLGEGDA